MKTTSSRNNDFVRWQHTHMQVRRPGNPHTSVRGANPPYDSPVECRWCLNHKNASATPAPDNVHRCLKRLQTRSQTVRRRPTSCVNSTMSYDVVRLKTCKTHANIKLMHSCATSWRSSRTGSTPAAQHRTTCERALVFQRQSGRVQRETVVTESRRQTVPHCGHIYLVLFIHLPSTTDHRLSRDWVASEPSRRLRGAWLSGEKNGVERSECWMSWGGAVSEGVSGSRATWPTGRPDLRSGGHEPTPRCHRGYGASANNAFICIAARMLDYTISATHDSAYTCTYLYL